MMSALSQQPWSCRCDWGLLAVANLHAADAIVVVDVLSFTTCVDIAVSRGAAILPYPWGDPTAAEFARTHGAELAGRRREARYSLAASSFLEAPAGLRCVLPSPNGARVALAAAQTPSVMFAACLRNASAVAAAAQRVGESVVVIPAGERWADGSLRPALEDWLGAGAVLSRLSGSRSPEADAAVVLFERYRTSLLETLQRCGSGRELMVRGRLQDLSLASELDASISVPRFDGTAFVAPY